MAVVKKVLQPTRQETIKLCHNDLNNENIMLVSDKKQVYFIDYEYSRYNYVAYDIANFLNEAAISYRKPETPYFEVLEDCQSTEADIF